MNVLKPLVWIDSADRSEAKHEFFNYRVIPDHDSFGKFAVRYKDSNSQPATGFATIEDAKAWAQDNYIEKMQPYLEPDTISDYFDKFTQWGLGRGIIQNGNVLAQGLKLVSEIGELSDNLAKGRCIKDDIGDCMVVLNMLAQMQGLELEDCLAQAWGDIKDRKGFMNEHGVFIKESDYE